MLLGQQTAQLDEKNRVRVPVKFRRQLGSNFVIVCGPGRFLLLMSSHEFDHRYAPMSPDLCDPEAIEAQFEIISSAAEAEEDSQGRFVIPQHLRKYAGIDKRICFRGAGDLISVWADDSEDGCVTPEKMKQNYRLLGGK